MATARAFPSIKPTSRSYTPGIIQVQTLNLWMARKHIFVMEIKELMQP